MLVIEKQLPDTAGTAAAQRLMRSAIFVLIILEQNYATNSWFKIKNARWLTYWGTYTYGLYCLHPIVLEGLLYGSDYLRLAPSALHTVFRVAISLPLSAGLAWLSYTYWEKPFLRLKKPAPAYVGGCLPFLPTRRARACALPAS